MRQSLQRGSIEKIRERALESREKAIDSLRDLMSDPKYSKFKESYINYEREVVSHLKCLDFSQCIDYASEIAVYFAELRILEQIIKKEDIVPQNIKNVKKEKDETNGK